MSMGGSGHSMQSRAGALLPLYAFTLFLSALLAFWIQPLFAKVILPRYGGSPAVWTTAAMFFQVMLLAGYFYAHLLSRLALRSQFVLHALVVVAAFVSLPVGTDTIETGVASPLLSLLLVLALTLGLPFFAVSATAPLLQQWFARTGHRHAADPYFLYSASNAGSLVALIGYPLVFEPLLGLRQQTYFWSIGCAAFAAALLACGASAWRVRREPNAAAAMPSADLAFANWRSRMRWALLAFAPSSLMLGVTQHITSEIAAVPLLWLIPMTIYMLTFVVAFARRQFVSAALVLRLQPLSVVLLALVWPLNNQPSVLVLHLLVFAVTAMMCHAELARTRPHVRDLTAFYLCLAIGGAAGGVFNALIAPLAFDAVLEYPLALALACALRRTSAAPRRAALWQDLWPAALLAGVFAALVYADIRPFAHGAWSIFVYLQVIGVGLYLLHDRPRPFALALAVLLLATPAVHSAGQVLERHRSFFGVHSVVKDETGKLHVLMHGITVHGAQFRDAERRLKPTTYYHAGSPIGQLFTVLGRHGDILNVAVIGMGIGTLACYRAPGRIWTFYEIDPLVVRLAKDARYFHFLEHCAPEAKIVVGDGRLSLAQARGVEYDLIVIDTFSSDAIPAHMITREALALYLSRISERGIIIFHVTNQYLDLVPVLARLATEAGVAALMPGPRLEIEFEERLSVLPSTWVAMARDAQRLKALDTEEGWIALPTPRSGKAWTDDFSNVLRALK